MGKRGNRRRIRKKEEEVENSPAKEAKDERKSRWRIRKGTMEVERENSTRSSPACIIGEPISTRARCDQGLGYH